jgi:hypothetical protein
MNLFLLKFRNSVLILDKEKVSFKHKNKNINCSDGRNRVYKIFIFLLKKNCKINNLKITLCKSVLTILRKLKLPNMLVYLTRRKLKAFLQVQYRWSTRRFTI